eukprot:2201927-Rhodomonas_salina.2
MEGSADVCQRLLQVVLALFVIGSLSAAHSAPIIAAPHITEQHADSSAVKTVQTTLVSAPGCDFRHASTVCFGVADVGGGKADICGGLRNRIGARARKRAWTCAPPIEVALWRPLHRGPSLAQLCFLVFLRLGFAIQRSLSSHSPLPTSAPLVVLLSTSNVHGSLACCHCSTLQDCLSNEVNITIVGKPPLLSSSVRTHLRLTSLLSSSLSARLLFSFEPFICSSLLFRISHSTLSLSLDTPDLVFFLLLPRRRDGSDVLAVVRDAGLVPEGCAQGRHRQADLCPPGLLRPLLPCFLSSKRERKQGMNFLEGESRVT